MRIHPLSPRADQKACRLESQAFDAAVEVVGLDAAELAWLFGYPGGTPFAWRTLRERGPIRIGLAGTGAAGAACGERITTELDDGRVDCGSGQTAVLEISDAHDSPGDRFARSLNLALSQQWARAGVMVVHAAGVALEDRGALILGSKASGKSTLTAAVLAAGGQAVSDDWMLLGTDAEGRLRMERMRGFLMLRRSWATDCLLGAETGLNYQAMAHRPKYTLAANGHDPRFPSSHTVDQVCVLKRDSTRPECSERFPVPPRSTMAALIAAGMPLLFSAGFPLERQQLNVLISGLLARTSRCGIICGLDVPAGAANLTRLLITESSPSCNPVDAEGQWW